MGESSRRDEFTSDSVMGNRFGRVMEMRNKVEVPTLWVDAYSRDSMIVELCVDVIFNGLGYYGAIMI